MKAQKLHWKKWAYVIWSFTTRDKVRVLTIFLSWSLDKLGKNLVEWSLRKFANIEVNVLAGRPAWGIILNPLARQFVRRTGLSG